MSDLVKKENPPNIEEIQARFPSIKGQKGIIYTYDKVIYNPDGMPLTSELVAHEMTHIKQQAEHKGGVKGWWKQYLEDDGFRFAEELEAYSRQYIVFCDSVKDRNQRATYLFFLAKHLSSPQYGSIISTTDAQNILRQTTKKYTKK